MIVCEHHATRAKATVKGDFNARPSDFTVESMIGLDGIDPPGVGGELTVENRWEWEAGTDGMEIEILWDTDEGVWYPNNIICPTDPTPTYF
jgi:hypothetical protein